MKKLIFIAGMLGSGKSTLLEQLKPVARTFCVDQIQGEAAKRAFPFADPSKYWHWDIWPENKSNMQIGIITQADLTFNRSVTSRV